MTSQTLNLLKRDKQFISLLESRIWESTPAVRIVEDVSLFMPQLWSDYGVIALLLFSVPFNQGYQYSIDLPVNWGVIIGLKLIYFTVRDNEFYDLLRFSYLNDCLINQMSVIIG